MNLAQARALWPNLQDYSDQELLDMAASQNGVEAGSKGYDTLKKEFLGYDRSWGDVAQDTAVQLGQGVLNVGKTGAALVGGLLPGVSAYDNVAMRTLDQGVQGLEQYKSRGLQNMRAGAQVASDIAAREAAARGETGVDAAVSAGKQQIRNYWDNPALLAEDVVTNLPQLAVGGVGGRLVGAGLRLGGAGAGAINAGRIAGAVGTGAVMQGQQAAEQTYRDAIQAGADHDTAQALAQRVWLQSGAASAALGALPFTHAIEARMAGAATRGFGLGRLGQIGASVGAEGLSEAVDEGFGQYATNRAVQQVDPTRDSFQGVGENAVQGFAASGPVAAWAGATGRRVQPRTRTGDIDLTQPPTSPEPPLAEGTAGNVTVRFPADLDRPTARRQGVDIDASSAEPAPQQPLALPYNPTMFVDPSGAATVGQMPTEQEVAQRRFAPQPTDPIDLTEPPAPQEDTSFTDLAGPAVDPNQRTPAQFTDLVEGDGLPPDPFAVPPETRPVERPAAQRPTNGQLLQAIQGLKKSYTRKDGNLANNAGGLAMRKILEAQDPMAAVRSMYENGGGARDEMLDALHQRFTGQTIDAYNAAQAAAARAAEPDTNSAGFVPEPLEDIKAQIQAVKDKRKPAVVLGTEEAAKVNPAGLARATVTDKTTGESAVVFTRTKRELTPVQKRVDAVGLQQALGELQQVANPGLTARPTDAPVAAVRQTDDATGAVLSEELVTPQDVANVKPISGATAEMVPAGDPVARRRAAAQDVNTVNPEDAQPATPTKAPRPRLGKRPVQELVGLANTTKDDATYNAAEDELYRRWVDFGDEQAENYFLDDVRPAKKGGSRAAAFSDSAHGQELKARYDAALEAKGAQAAQKLGKKFGASLREPTGDIYDGIQVRENTTAKQRSIGRRAFDSLRKFLGVATADGPRTGETGQGDSGISNAGPAAPSARPADTTDRRSGSERAGAPGVSSGPGAEEGLIPRRLRGQVSVLAHRLAADFQAGKSAALVGQKIESPEDLAVLAQVYRNPHFETFRVIYLDASGTVTGEAGYSSRLPGSTATPTTLGDRIAADKKRYGAVRFMVMHNHPSGSAAPSPADVSATRSIARTVPGFGGHVIIDHNEFATIRADGNWRLTAKQFGATDFNAQHAVPNPVLGEKVQTEDQLAALTKALQVPGDHATLVLLNAQQEVNHVSDIPTALLNIDRAHAGVVKASAFIRRMTRASGAAGSTVLVLPEGSDVPAGIQPLVNLGVISVVADSGGKIVAASPAGNDLIGLYARRKAIVQDDAGLRDVSIREAVSPGLQAALPGAKAIGDAAKVVTASVKAQATGHEVSSTLLGAMTLHQIVEHFGGKLPAMRSWANALFERGAVADKLASAANRVAKRWENSIGSKAQSDALNDILMRASVAELRLDDTSPEYVASLDERDRAEYVALRQKLAALPPELQAVRREALKVLSDQWSYVRSSLRTFIEHTIPDPDVRAERIKQLDDEMGRNRGDYFPLSRFGDRIVIGVGAGKDGGDVVSFHESAASAETERKRLQAAGVKKVIMNMITARDPRLRTSTGLMGELHAMIENSEASPDAKESLHETLQQLYLKSLPELSGAKHMMRREGVEGYSQDAMRVFADAVTRGSRYAAHLDYAPRIQAAMESAELQSRSSDKRSATVVIGRKDGAAPVVRVTAPGVGRYEAVRRLMDDGYKVEYFSTVPETVNERVAGHLPEYTDEQRGKLADAVSAVVGRDTDGVEDLRAAKTLYNHMVKLQQSMRTEDGVPDKLVDLLGQVGYVWYLGFTPAFWTMNLLQNPMIGIPHLGARYGVARSVREWGRAMRWFSNVRIGKLLADRKEPFSIEWLRKQNLAGVTKQELAMLQTLEDSQALDFTQARDLGRIGENSNSSWTKAMRLAAAGAHHTEVFNRVTYALAEYRLALKSGANVTHEQAVQKALDGVRNVHFDYTPENKPLLMRGKYRRLILMFQQYRQHMLHWWGNTVKDAVAGESPEVKRQARKAAFLMGATHAMFAGALGMPFVGTVAMLANMFAPDDDDGVPFDFERWVTEAAKEATGSDKAAEVMTKGIFTALNMNIGQRIGQADLLPLLNEGSWKYERNTDDKMKSMLVDMLGPLGSIAVNAAGSVDAFSRGDTLAGLAAVTPKAVADMIKAADLGAEGIKNSKGDTLVAAESMSASDVLMQAIGVNPASVARMKANKNAVYEIEAMVKDRAGRLRNQFVEAWARGDRDGMREAVGDIQAYNQKIAGGKLAAVPGALIDGRSLESAVRRAQQRALILALTGGTADTKRRLAIALSMSGLIDQVTPQSMQEAAGDLPPLPGIPR